MDPFVDQLKTLCRTFPTRSKWVFVPTHAIGRTLGDRLVLEGTDWANLRFVTPLDIALRMGAPFLVERGIDPSEEELGPALMMRLLLALPREGGYFRPLDGHPTLAQALWTTVRELRMAGLGPDALTPAAFTSPAKHAELVALLRAYEQFLVDHKSADMATVYHEALQHQGWCPIHSQDCWTELPDANWNPLQQRLLDSLPGERIHPHAFALVGVDVPRRLKPRPTTRVSPEAATNPLAHLMTPPSSPPSSPRIDLFHAGGREAEIEEVFRRILASGVSLDQVEIACGSDAHMALVWEKALRHNWPATLGAGIPATLTRPGRALIDKANPPGKLADAELHFTDGVLDGLKLIGFAVWERRSGSGRNVTFPARQYSVNGERRSFALLRPIADAAAQERVRDLVLQAYAEYEEAATEAAS